jgi:hypothetical protein
VNKDKNSVIRQLVSQQGEQVRKQMQAVTLEQHQSEWQLEQRKSKKLAKKDD